MIEPYFDEFHYVNPTGVHWFTIHEENYGPYTDKESAFAAFLLVKDLYTTTLELNGLEIGSHVYIYAVDTQLCLAKKLARQTTEKILIPTYTASSIGVRVRKSGYYAYEMQHYVNGASIFNINMSMAKEY